MFKLTRLQLFAIVSGIIVVVAGFLFWREIPSLLYNVWFGLSSGGLETVRTMHDFPIIPLLIVTLGIASIVSALKKGRHLPILVSACFGVIATLSLWFYYDMYESFIHTQVYGVPLGWLVCFSRTPPGWNIGGTAFIQLIIDVAFWSVIFGMRFLVKRKEGLVLSGLILGIVSYLIFVLVFIVGLLVNPYFPTPMENPSALVDMLFGIVHFTFSAHLFAWYYPYAGVDNPAFLALSVLTAILGFVGIVLTYTVWRKIRLGESAMKKGVIGGVMMILGSPLLFGFIGGILTILGAVDSVNETNEAPSNDI